MRRLTSFLAASALLACGSTPGPPPPQPGVVVPPPVASAPPIASVALPPSPEARQNRLIARMLKRVEVARGLESKKPVPGVLLERTALIARVKDHVTRELPP